MNEKAKRTAANIKAGKEKYISDMMKQLELMKELQRLMCIKKGEAENCGGDGETTVAALILL